MNFDKELTNFHLARKNTQRKRHDEDRRKAGLNKKEKEKKTELVYWLGYERKGLWRRAG